MAVESAKRLDALLALGALIAPKSKKLAESVTQAFREPKAYIAAHAEAMNDRGIDRPRANLPWIALIDALDEAGRLAEIDWKTDAEDVEWNVRRLAKGFRLPKLDDPELDDRSTWELLELAGIELRKKKLQLAQLDMGSDAYPLVVVPRSQFRTVERLAKQAHYDEARAFGDALGAAVKERIASETKQRRDAAREDARPKPAWLTFGKGKATRSIKVALLACDLGYEEPGMKRYEFHYFKSAAAGRAYGAKTIASWKAEGFRKLTQAEFDALPKQGDGAYLGWTAPFPKDARYFLENARRVIRCVALRGDALMETGGVVGKNFGELENHRHGPAAAQELAATIARYESAPKFYVPIARAALITLHAKKR